MPVHGQKSTAKGYTLLELMIVLAILVTVMAVAWPSIARRIKIIGPREAALQVKADLAEAREEAVRTGEAWAVRIERGGANYELAPVRIFREALLHQTVGSTQSWLEDQPSRDASPLSVTDGSTAVATEAPIEASADRGPEEMTGLPTDEQTPRVRHRRSQVLPAGMIFDDGFAHRVSDANEIQQPTLSNSAPTLAPQPPAPENWKVVVIFQPDGRATESEIRLRDRTTESTIRLRVRGFTGGVSLDRVEPKRKTVAPTMDDASLVDDDTVSQTSDPTGQNDVLAPTSNLPGQNAGPAMELR